MIRTFNYAVMTASERYGLRHYLQKAAVSLWRFSQFYGDYQSLPPSKRRQLVINKQRQEEQAEK
jgi:hypothetical protein